MRKLCTIAATLLAVTASLVVPAAQAHANVNGPMLGKGSLLCLSVANNSTADGAKVIQWGCQNPPVPSQQWYSVPHVTIPNTLMVINYNSGKCLSVENSSTADNADLIQWGCIASGSAAQAWFTSPTNDSDYLDYWWVNVGSYKCMSVRNAANTQGAQIIQWGCMTPPSHYQAWY